MLIQVSPHVQNRFGCLNWQVLTCYEPAAKELRLLSDNLDHVFFYLCLVRSPIFRDFELSLCLKFNLLFFLELSHFFGSQLVVALSALIKDVAPPRVLILVEKAYLDDFLDFPISYLIEASTVFQDTFADFTLEQVPRLPCLH